MATPRLTDAQCEEALAALAAAGGNESGAARSLGLCRTTFQSRVREARRRYSPTAGGLGAGPERDGLAPYVVKGVSTYFDARGEPRGQWVKTKVDEEARLRGVEAALIERAERMEPLPLTPLDSFSREGDAPKLLNLITITDYHLGMLAWHREGGADWDMPIARETFQKCFGGMLSLMPRAKECVINQLGDFLHSDSLVPMTPAHGNVLDADSRYQKMFSVAADLMEWVIVEALRRHERVHVILAEGNHDESSSVALRVMFRRLFRDEPRVTIDDSPFPYYARQHGNVMLAFHHGHKLKPADMPSLFAAEFAPMWGETTRRYAHLGHQHHTDEKEHRGMIVLQHPTLAARDAYAARGGWIADRRSIGITYHHDYGEVGRTIVTPEMFGLESEEPCPR